MPTMRASSPSRYSHSVVSSVRQTMRSGPRGIFIVRLYFGCQRRVRQKLRGGGWWRGGWVWGGVFVCVVVCPVFVYFFFFFFVFAPPPPPRARIASRRAGRS